MCDTLVVVPPRAATVVLAKNSDREPGEAQAIEVHPARTHAPGARLRATWIELDQAQRTHAVVLSRPAWMWGAEMGVNEHGVAIGNEAVFTRLPVAEMGLTGMDLLRLALERAKDADEALELVTWLIARHGQGGRCGYRARSFRYHSAFVIADPRGAWLLETAGPFWAALRIEGARTSSNVLSIGPDATRLGPGTVEEARRRGWLRRGETFDFARCFADPFYARLTGGHWRRACTARSVARGEVGAAQMASALRDHAGLAPHEGARLVMPCAHASWLPTRHAGQTTASMIAELAPGAPPRVWATGTSSPCLSVWKPVPLEGGDLGPAPRSDGADRESLWWRHERLHRAVLRDYETRRSTFEDERAELEARAWSASDASAIWAEHRERVAEWRERAERVPAAHRAPRAFTAWWALQSARDGLA